MRSQPNEKFCTGQVVEAVLQIMDHRPQPMRNMKPSKKNPNGADQFQADHEEEYEKYEDEIKNKDRVKQVDGHNTAFPKMKDELERRRSTAEASPSVPVSKRRAVNEMYLDPNCRACQKLMKAAKAKTKKRTISKPRTRYSRKRRPVKKSRVSKPRRAYRRANLGEMIYFAEDYSQTTLTNPSVSHHGSKSDVVNPDTSANSLSSYNSNMCLDHEPMVPQ